MMKPIDHNLARTADAAQAWDEFGKFPVDGDIDELCAIFDRMRPIVQDDVLLKEMIAELE